MEKSIAFGGHNNELFYNYFTIWKTKYYKVQYEWKIQSWEKVCYILYKGSTYKKYNRLVPTTVLLVDFQIEKNKNDDKILKLWHI